MYMFKEFIKRDTRASDKHGHGPGKYMRQAVGSCLPPYHVSQARHPSHASQVSP